MHYEIRAHTLKTIERERARRRGPCLPRTVTAEWVSKTAKALVALTFSKENTEKEKVEGDRKRERERRHWQQEIWNERKRNVERQKEQYFMYSGRG